MLLKERKRVEREREGIFFNTYLSFHLGTKFYICSLSLLSKKEEEGTVISARCCELIINKERRALPRSILISRLDSSS
jgi:hypothetical protein